MAIHGVHHVVLLVDDVPAAEAFYHELFDLPVLFREGALDGDTGTVPDHVDWDEARSNGVTPTMSFLGGEDGAFSLAVARADCEETARRLDHIALAVDEQTFEAVTKRAERFGCTVVRNAAHHRTFEDLQGFEWELNTRSPPPRRAFDTLSL